MPNVVYESQYLCIQLNVDNPTLCDVWQEVHSGNFITPELAGQIIMFAFIINILVYGLIAVKRVT